MALCFVPALLPEHLSGGCTDRLGSDEIHLTVSLDGLELPVIWIVIVIVIAIIIDEFIVFGRFIAIDKLIVFGMFIVVVHFCCTATFEVLVHQLKLRLKLRLKWHALTVVNLGDAWPEMPM
jgi:dolichyl-phosphate-mannose--protein O-mannosyl transferase